MTGNSIFIPMISCLNKILKARSPQTFSNCIAIKQTSSLSVLDQSKVDGFSTWVDSCTVPTPGQESGRHPWQSFQRPINNTSLYMFIYVTSTSLFVTITPFTVYIFYPLCSQFPQILLHHPPLCSLHPSLQHLAALLPGSGSAPSWPW